MIRHFYHLPTATLAANPPSGHWLSSPCPGTPTVSIVVVLAWDGHDAQDTWEALPGVVEHYPENLGLPAPAGVITACAPWGATAGMTLRQVWNCIRANWGVWRP